MDIEQRLLELYKQKKKLEKEIASLEQQQKKLAKNFIVLSDKIYIDTAKLPRRVVEQLKELATFDNPQIETLKRLRKPIYNTPYKIQSYAHKGSTLALPRGLMRSMIELLSSYKIDYSFTDNRFVKNIVPPKFSLTLRDEQQKVINEISKKDFAIFVAAPGFGKTVIGAKMIEQRGVNALVIVNKNLLLDQWIERFTQYFDIEKKQIGYLGKSKNKLTGSIDVATMQSLKNNTNIIENYSFVIVDECHHIPALTFESIIKKFCGKYILGLSATPHRKDGMDPLLYQQLGSIAYEHKQKKIGKKEYRIIETDFVSDVDNFGELINQIANDERRNHLIIDLIKQYKDRKILLLSDRIEHLDNIELLLKYNKLDFVTIHGSLNKEEQQKSFELVKTSSLVLATTSYFGEGIDFPHLDTIIFATPISYYGRLVQYLGRIGRGGSDSLALDLLDIHNKFALSSYKKRKQGYKELHYIKAKP
jgi:superfamily II DNA or RNA helicase